MSVAPSTSGRPDSATSSKICHESVICKPVNLQCIPDDVTWFTAPLTLDLCYRIRTNLLIFVHVVQVDVLFFI